MMFLTVSDETLMRAVNERQVDRPKDGCSLAGPLSHVTISHARQEMCGDGRDCTAHCFIALGLCRLDAAEKDEEKNLERDVRKAIAQMIT
jgi:hypothetical protein